MTITKGNLKKTNLKQRLTTKQDKLFDKKINPFTLEKLIRHNHHGKVKPSNKMIEEYYARREHEIQAAKIYREKANRGGIYNFRMSKYDNIFKTTKQQQSPQKPKLTFGMKQQGKSLTFNRFTDEYLTKKNDLIIKTTDDRPVIDLFDENNIEKQPPIIVYDSVKGIYVMQNPKIKQITTAKNNTNIAQNNSTLKDTKIYDDAPRQRYAKTSKHGGYVANRIDPNKKPTFLSQIKDQPEELSEFKKHNEDEKSLSFQNNVMLPTTNLQSVSKKPVKFSKKQFLKQLETKHYQKKSYAPNYYQTIYSSKKSFRNFLRALLQPLLFYKLTNKTKRWNK
ncbi:hypothetical protein S100390_v1c05500 [Spiroplasma sp. NBRC 100390]|uniref:hypothetical protein n=1 Tax=unclassified Spiroplasma TaxID=2637901 RepID=UPI00089282F8|nr:MULTISPECIES: hypothetical protein [unclassified Spiroplasma]AOX43889.1 hypothetical protein STU14_v1c05500 [Spiroplasma sp. TU-14]APE13359.1 hypothetical protein S100390_v1c05500 [Spiroplasma sp. NBRC 100390]